jgi:hypothetical protein
MMFVVYFTTTGDADSFGTVLADPMPDQFTVRPLTDDEAAMLADGTGIWNPTTRTIEPRPPSPDPNI